MAPKRTSGSVVAIARSGAEGDPATLECPGAGRGAAETANASRLQNRKMTRRAAVTGATLRALCSRRHTYASYTTSKRLRQAILACLPPGRSGERLNGGNQL